jgi:hypothetical protein
MRFVRLIPIIAAATFFVGPAGCGGGPKFAKVSGIVTLDQKPYPNAIVAFQPIGSAKNPTPGRGSSALTDENGQFTLMTDDGESGAVVGKHRVRIQTKRNDPTAFFDPTTGNPDNYDPRGKKTQFDPIPLDWYSDQSKKEFDVPAGGTDKANFDIVSIKRK